MAANDIVALIILLLAYLMTWFLFFRSLKIVNIIDSEKLKHLNQIRERLFRRRK